MITVFVVLTLVVITGKILIRIVNRLFPEIETRGSFGIEGAKVAAITTAVEIVTEGTGRITKIEKQNQYELRKVIYIRNRLPTF